MKNWVRIYLICTLIVCVSHFLLKEEVSLVQICIIFYLLEIKHKLK